MASSLFTSESVSMGHPDKISDQISDGILDAILAQDKGARVACESLVTTGLAMIAGEITTTCYVDMPEVIRGTIKRIGYNDASMGLDWQTCSVLVSIDKQSPDISQGVTAGEGLHKDLGAGDQGLMFGYANKETEHLMPAPIHYSHRLMEQIAKLRLDGGVSYLRPDAKSQVTCEYDGNELKRVHTVVISTQHGPEVSHEAIKKDMIEKVIRPIIPANLLDENTIFHINPTGRFVIGGPQGDCGLTGRKIIVDTYGGRGRHGGGAFSGKDPTKVDRSACYAARWVSKNLVAAGIADECEVQLAYAIGVSEPVSVAVNSFGTGKIDDEKMAQLVRDNFDLTPSGIITGLDLLRPIYQVTAAHGHFGRPADEGGSFTWERLNKADDLRKGAGL